MRVKSDLERKKQSKLKNLNIFMTGGGGFIGSALCKQLVDNNNVVIYDNGHRSAIKYTDLLKHENLKFIQGNIFDRKKVEQAAKDSDIIIHLAAIAGIDSVAIDPLNTMKTNLIGTYELLESVKNMDLKRFVFFSTSEVYGSYAFRANEKNATSQGEVGIQRWTYSTSKIAAEHLAHCYYSQFGLPLTIIRPFNIYGRRQVGEGAIHKFIVNAIKNEDLTVYGDGMQIRTWCYIDDIVDAVILSLVKKEAVGNIFNIGNASGTITVLGLAQKIIDLSNSKSKIVFEERDFPDVELRVPDISKAKKMLGFKPKIDLDEGIKRTIDWYMTSNGEKR